jgi:glutamate racemase
MTGTPSGDRPIGVFDSGVGGLTVLRALRRQLPGESMVYLGDTARVPYGTKSPASVLRYATQATDHLVARGIKLLVVACNTASALAIDALREHFRPLPVVGVVEPGAAAAVAASRNQHHLVLATESTVKHHAYARAIHALAPGAEVEEVPCSLLVALAEEGWTEGPIPESVARAYLEPVFRRAGTGRPDCVVLGCTHFPLLAEAIRAVIGPAPALVDSATTTAAHVEATLTALRALHGPASPRPIQFLATDGPERFADVGSRFLGEPFQASEVEIVDL